MQKAIVIGATSGIGKGLARLLAENGYKVGITGRRTELLESLKAENPETFVSSSFDITRTENIPQHLEELVNELGGLDLLVLSSGTGDLNKNLSFEKEKQTIDTNVSGFTAVADWTFNYFQQQKRGHFTAISSIAGLRGGRQAPAYNASKAYQISYLEALRQRAGHKKIPIVITDIRPGFVDTDMAKGEGMFWVASVDKAAKQIYDAIKGKKKIAYVSGRWKIIAGILKVLPGFFYEKM